MNSTDIKKYISDMWYLEYEFMCRCCVFSCISNLTRICENFLQATEETYNITWELNFVSCFVSIFRGIVIKSSTIHIKNEKWNRTLSSYHHFAHSFVSYEKNVVKTICTTVSEKHFRYFNMCFGLWKSVWKYLIVHANFMRTRNERMWAFFYTLKLFFIIINSFQMLSADFSHTRTNYN